MTPHTLALEACRLLVEVAEEGSLSTRRSIWCIQHAIWKAREALEAPATQQDDTRTLNIGSGR